MRRMDKVMRVKRTIKIGTRTSALAMAQTQLIADAIKAADEEAGIELIPLSTLGDRILDKPLLSFGGKGAFVSEFEEALLAGRIDLAVHSAKDMPMELPQGLEIIGIPKREDARDVLVTMKGTVLRPGAVIGTSSLRRQMQISQLKEVVCKDLRGNVNTRLRKLEEGQYDGIILAAAGLKRLGLHQEKKFDYHYFSYEEFVPAGGQGIIAVEGRAEDELKGLLSRINDSEAESCLRAERYVLKLLDAGCHEPIGVYSYIEDGRLHLSIINGQDEGIKKASGSAPVSKYKELAAELVAAIKKKED